MARAYNFQTSAILLWETMVRTNPDDQELQDQLTELRLCLANLLASCPEVDLAILATNESEPFPPALKENLERRL
jgi:hypothetical protein